MVRPWTAASFPRRSQILTNMSFHIDTPDTVCYNKTAKNHYNKPLSEGSGFLRSCEYNYIITHTLGICKSNFVDFMCFGVLHKSGGMFLDIVLKRILSLIPQKPNGKFVHGAVKEFANGLGLKTGNIVSDWIAGRSKSYESYIYQIASKYNVSVKWLRGETDERKPIFVFENGLSAEAKELIRLFDLASPELRSAALAVLKSAEAADKAQNDEVKEK